MSTQVAEKTKEKVEKLNCSPVEILSFKEIVEKFVSRSPIPNTHTDLRKSIIKYALGFSKESVFNNAIRMRNYSKTEINELKNQLNTARVISVVECVYDLLVFNANEKDAVQLSLTNEEDLHYVLSIMELKSFDLNQSIYELPTEIDPDILKVRIPESRRIDTQSKLGNLVEDFLDKIINTPNMNVSFRKLFAKYVIGEIKESELISKIYNNETPYRKIILYTQNNFNAIHEAIKGGKSEKAFKEDAEYVLNVLK